MRTHPPLLLPLSLCAAALCALLAGCSAPDPVATQPPSPTVAVSPSPPLYSAEDALAVFEAENLKNGLSGRTATACVLVDDHTDGMTAVLLYTDEEQNNTCQLAFVFDDDVYFPVGIAANEQDQVRDFEPVPGTLTYEGDGTATIVLQQLATGTHYRYTIACARLTTDVNFTIESDILS